MPDMISSEPIAPRPRPIAAPAKIAVPAVSPRSPRAVAQASPQQLRLLADEYRASAHHLLNLGRRRQPLSWAPCRLTAIHAVELYLSAFLIHRGHTSSDVRGLQHDLGARCDLAVAGGLKLRKLTAAHLHTLAGNKEYLVSRYAPDMAANVTQINRLMATLDEVGTKTAAALAD